jgi:hypothetical protein
MSTRSLRGTEAWNDSMKTIQPMVLLILAVNAMLAAANMRAADSEPRKQPTGKFLVPRDVDYQHPLYESSFRDPAALKDWRLEGGKRMSVAAGKLVLESEPGSTKSEDDANHLVCWLTHEMPADFLLEFTVRPQNRRQGLNIVFFNARGIHGENIFQPPIKPRDGRFPQYHSGDLNSYHVSYWAGDRGTANIRKNHGFHLVASGKDLVASGPAESFQTIRVYKRGGKIRLMVDDEISVAYDDDGKSFGPVHTNSGWIGLRQMAHAVHCEYGYVKVFPLTQVFREPAGGAEKTPTYLAEVVMTSARRPLEFEPGCTTTKLL